RAVPCGCWRRPSGRSPSPSVSYRPSLSVPGPVLPGRRRVRAAWPSRRRPRLRVPDDDRVPIIPCANHSGAPRRAPVVPRTGTRRSGQARHRVDGGPVDVDLEVQVARAREPGVARVADDVALVDPLPARDGEARQVVVARHEALPADHAVVDEHLVAEPAATLGVHHRAERGRHDRRPAVGAEVGPGVQAPDPEDGVQAHAVARRHVGHRGGVRQRGAARRGRRGLAAATTTATAATAATSTAAVLLLLTTALGLLGGLAVTLRLLGDDRLELGLERSLVARVLLDLLLRGRLALLDRGLLRLLVGDELLDLRLAVGRRLARGLGGDDVLVRLLLEVGDRLADRLQARLAVACDGL